MEVLVRYIKNNLYFPKDIASLCKKYTLDEILEHKDLNNEKKKSGTKNLIWKTYVQSYVRRTEVQKQLLEYILGHLGTI